MTSNSNFHSPVGLRDGSFLVPPGGDWNDIDDMVKTLIQEHWKELQEAWDQKYPSNPVASEEDKDDEAR